MFLSTLSVSIISENKIIVKLFASSWYISLLIYIYDARSHLHQISYFCLLVLFTQFILGINKSRAAIQLKK